MTASENFDWSPPPLDSSDQKLIEAYRRIGLPLDTLPYTDKFDELMRFAGMTISDVERHHVWKRLVSLRKRALLPRQVMPSNGEGTAGEQRAM